MEEDGGAGSGGEKRSVARASNRMAGDAQIGCEERVNRGGDCGEVVFDSCSGCQSVNRLDEVVSCANA